MSGSTVAKRYATALFEIAKQHQVLDSVEEELRVVKQVVADNDELNAVLKSPKLTIQQKKDMLKVSFGKVSTYVLNTLMLLVDRHREELIVDVVDQFIEFANDERGIADATVYTIRPLTEEESKALSQTYAAKVGKKSLRINNIVDTNLLGGVKIRIGNRILDGSLSGKLERLERHLLG